MKLRQIAAISAGYPFRGRIPEVANTGVVAVQMKDLSPSEGIDWQGCVNTTLEGKREPDWLQPGDILVAARGSHNYAVQVDDGMIGAGLQAVAAPHFFVVRTKKNDILPDYLVWLLNQAPCQRYFDQNAEGSLTKSIRRSVMDETPVTVPPLAKQRTIVGMANALRQEQRIVEQMLRNSERMMNAIARDLLAAP